jgi:sugar (glycoside-pentoside-hexuronide) transporter
MLSELLLTALNQTSSRQSFHIGKRQEKIPMMNDKITKKTIASFAAGGMAYHLFVGMFTGYQMIFYTDVFGLSTMAVGTLLLIARSWDAFNDPIIGILVDKAPKTKIGKFRPFILWTALPFSVFAVLCFYAPDLSPAGKLIYAYITYIMYGMLYTVFEIPYWALATSFTQNTKERGLLISVARSTQVVAAAIAILLFLPLVNLSGRENLKHGYLMAASLYGVIALVAFFILYAGTREKVVSISSERFSFSQILNVLRFNKPLWIMTVVLLLQIFNEIGLNSGTYFAAYCLGDINLYTPIVGVATGGMVIGSITMPFFSKLCGGKKNLFIYSRILRILILSVFFFVGYENLFFVFLLIGISYTLSGIDLPIISTMYMECIEFNQWKNGQRKEGLILSIHSFAWKIVSAAAGALLAFLLAKYGYIPNQEQTQLVKTVIFSSQTILIIIGSLLSIIVMLFYPLTEVMHQEITLKLKTGKGQ